MMKKKPCTKCKVVKFFGEFYKNKGGKFGLRSACKTCQSKYEKKWREKNKERIKIRKKEYDSQECVKERKRIYARNNRHKSREYQKNRRKSDLRFRVTCNLRTRIYQVVKGISKSNNTMKLSGCDLEFFLSYIESMFISGMSWSNYGKVWHIDHKMPCAFFDLSDFFQQEICFHYTNLQPMFAEENMRKKNNIVVGELSRKTVKEGWCVKKAGEKQVH